MSEKYESVVKEIVNLAMDKLKKLDKKQILEAKFKIFEGNRASLWGGRQWYGFIPDSNGIAREGTSFCLDIEEDALTDIESNTVLYSVSRLLLKEHQKLIDSFE